MIREQLTAKETNPARSRTPTGAGEALGRRKTGNRTPGNALTLTCRPYSALRRQHFAHLYGPVTLVEDHKADILHNGDVLDVEAEEVGTQTSTEGLPGLADQRFPGVQLRRRSPFDWPVQGGGQGGGVQGPGARSWQAGVRRPSSAAAHPGAYMSAQEVAESTETLRKAFRASPYQKVTRCSQETSGQHERRHQSHKESPDPFLCCLRSTAASTGATPWTTRAWTCRTSSSGAT